MKLGVVITTCAGRESNLARVYEHLSRLDTKPALLVTVFDGCPPFHPLPNPGLDWNAVKIDKHVPGAEQPRNVGVRKLRQLMPDTTHVWLLDSDIIFEPTIVDKFMGSYEIDPMSVLTGPALEPSSAGRMEHRVLIGPYEFLPGGDQIDHAYRGDVRWASFDEHGPEVAFVNSLGAALGNFGGNLVWPIDEFVSVGGFHPQLSHGRVEDGELGLRAAAAGVPMSFVREARAWHVWHPVNHQAKLAANAVEVPMLNAMHPWVQERGLVLSEADGARFDFKCDRCDLTMNCHDYWQHVEDHEHGREFTFSDPASVTRG